LTTIGRSDYLNNIYLDIKELTPAMDGQFTPAKDGQGHWLSRLILPRRLLDL
jgi:hypothetical protein